MPTTIAYAYELGLDFVENQSDDCTIIEEESPELARCLAMASLAALAQRLARVESELRDTSRRNRGKPWHRVRVSLRDRLVVQLAEAQERLEAI